MNSISKEEIKTLISVRKAPCVSLFMPTYRAGAEIQQNQIRFRNLLRESEEKLYALGFRSQEVKTLLDPVQNLIGNVLFWRHQSDGLVVFVSPEVFRYYCLPVYLDEAAVVSDRFQIKPLLPLLTGDGQFYILTLSQNENHLFECTKQNIREIELEAIPPNLIRALQYEEPEKQIRFHRGTARSGERSSMISGHGAELDNAKENILKYFRMIDRGLHDLLKDERRPLLLAGVEYLFPIYREANTYPHLMQEGIAGNPKGISTDQLHKQAWEIVKPYFQKAEGDAIAQYRQSSGTGLTSSDVREIITAAYHGRVGLLFIAKGMQQWGIFDPVLNEVHVHEKRAKESESLLDLSAIQTILNGGTVFVLEQERMPEVTPLAAVFRY
ncbi:MAG: hypothetical protein FJ139_04235 [Deltaproteobacteria bacterium]|nr:hypothetical protein [Deltaproteobacteria bacterium]